MFIEKGSVEYVEIDGKQVPVVKCDAEVIIKKQENKSRV